jgi:hypothetical protein
MTPRRASLKTASTSLSHPQRTLFSYLREEHDGAEAFHALRQTVLGTTTIRAHEAHLTLAHPRNPQAPANIAATFAALPPRLTVTFTAVALIEQRDAHPWVVRATVPLDRRHATDPGE